MSIRTVSDTSGSRAGFAGISASAEEIGPETARWVLSHVRLRVVQDERRIERYAQDMCEGRWRFGGEAIVVRLGEAPVLLNGWHRLHAVMRSGATISAVVVRIDEDVAHDEALQEVVSGTHRCRTAADLLTVAGVPFEARRVAAVLSHFGHWSGGVWRATPPSSDDIVALYRAVPEVVAAVRDDPGVGTALKPFRNVLLAFRLLAARASLPERAAEFDRGVRAWETLHERDPRRVLGLRLSALGLSGESVSRATVHALFAHAWNAWQTGRPMLPVSGDKGVPRLVGWSGLSLPHADGRNAGTRNEGVPPGVDVRVELVGPQAAKEYLRGNVRNRPPLAETVARYAADMADGAWEAIGAPLWFAADGTLLDGQQRLMAIIQSEREVPMVVVRGARDDAFAVFDRSPRRGLRKVLREAGMPRVDPLVGALRLLWYLRQGVFSGSPSERERLELLRLHKGLPDARAPWGATKLLGETQAMALAYLLPRLDRVAAESFLRKLAGEGEFRRGDPVGVLVRRLQDAKARRLGRGIGGSSPLERFRMVIEAWQRVREGRSSGGGDSEALRRSALAELGELVRRIEAEAASAKDEAGRPSLAREEQTERACHPAGMAG